MPYYKDADDAVFFFDTEPGDAARPLTQITEAQANGLMAPSIDDRKAAMWAEAKRLRDSAIDAGVPVAGIGIFDSDDQSRANISGAVTMALLAQLNAQAFSIGWKLADNTVTTLSGPQMIGAGVAVGQHVSECHEVAQGLGLAIDDAASHAALDAIDVTVGWP